MQEFERAAIVVNQIIAKQHNIRDLTLNISHVRETLFRTSYER